MITVFSRVSSDIAYTFFKNEFEGEFVLPSFFVLLLLTPIFPLFYVLFLRLLLIILCSCAKLILCRFWICIYCRNLPETFHYIIEIMLVLIVVSDY